MVGDRATRMNGAKGCGSGAASLARPGCGCTKAYVLGAAGAVGGFAAEGGYSTNSPPVQSTHNLVGERSDANPPPLAPYICMERRIAI